VLEATQALLDAIDSGDYEAYAKLCDEKLTAFEPEAQGEQCDHAKTPSRGSVIVIYAAKMLTAFEEEAQGELCMQAMTLVYRYRH
jgi:hypothetical protein